MHCTQIHTTHKYTLYVHKYTLHTNTHCTQFTVHIAHCPSNRHFNTIVLTLLTLQCTMYIVHYMLYSHDTLHSTQSAHCPSNQCTAHCTLHTLGCYTLPHCPEVAYSVHLDHHEATQTSSVKRGEPSSLDHHEVTPTGSAKCMLKHKHCVLNRPNIKPALYRSSL